MFYLSSREHFAENPGEKTEAKKIHNSFLFYFFLHHIKIHQAMYQLLRLFDNPSNACLTNIIDKQAIPTDF